MRAGDVTALGEAIRDIHGRGGMKFELRNGPRYREQRVIVDGFCVGFVVEGPDGRWTCFGKSHVRADTPEDAASRFLDNDG